MDDKQILDLYWERSEAAISETSKKYGKYCRYIAFNILHNDEDSEECVNDTYLRAWNSIPPNRPSVLKTFLGKITRNLSLDRYELLNAKKRNGGQMPLILDEIQECIPSLDSTENIVEEIALTDILNRFLSSLSLEQRKIFSISQDVSDKRFGNIGERKKYLCVRILTISSASLTKSCFLWQQ